MNAIQLSVMHKAGIVAIFVMLQFENEQYTVTCINHINFYLMHHDKVKLA